MGHSPWGHSESDTTERLSLSLHFFFHSIKVNGKQGFFFFFNLNDLESQYKAIKLMSDLMCI